MSWVVGRARRNLLLQKQMRGLFPFDFAQGQNDN
jgi:hypothetical protein